MKAPEEIKTILDSQGIERFRAEQLLHAIFKEGKNDYEQIKILPQNLRRILPHTLPIFSLSLVRSVTSKDGKTTKALFETKTPDKTPQKIEAVLMKFADGRHSLCVSSQAGCQLGCKFCATGTMKFGRNLMAEEIADQALYFAQRLMKEGKHITNVVYMGMGEPFMNYDNVLQSAKILNDVRGLNIGARNITLSTSGICEGIEKLADEPIQLNLAVSLHAPTQALRERIMPIARRYSLDQLMAAIQKYISKTNRRVSYEYVMLAGINDHEEEARALAELVKDQLCHVNLIPYNATGIQNIEGSKRADIWKFRDILKEAGIAVTVRVTLGQDIDAACGQLANKAQQAQVSPIMKA